LTIAREVLVLLYPIRTFDFPIEEIKEVFPWVLFHASLPLVHALS